MPKLVLATRASQLALAQAKWVASQLCQLSSNLKISIKTIKTTGDKILDTPLAQINRKGIFVKEIDEALLSYSADFAVHSMKDIPIELPIGLTIASISKREDPRDVLISREGFLLDMLPIGATIGTSSVRRQSQILAYRPDLKIVNLRGNVETRLKKMDKYGLMGIILAAAGLKRLGLDKIPHQILNEDIMLPAVGQGALGLECRSDDATLLSLLSKINHPHTAISIASERAFLAYLFGSSCQVPAAAYAKIENGTVIFKALIASLDGKFLLRSKAQSTLEEATMMGKRIAKDILNKDSYKILKAINKKG